MKKNFFISILICISLISFFLLYYNNNKDGNYNKIQKSLIKDGTLSYGIYDLDGKIINRNQVINNDNNHLEKVLSLGHYINEKRTYMLIILKDFKQSGFKINNRYYTKYKFTMKPYTSKKMIINLDLNKNTKEVDFLIIKKPDYILKENNIQRASILQEVISMRFKIKNNKEDLDLEYDKPLKIMKKGPYDNVFLSDSINELKVLYSENSNKEVYLTVGNTNSKKINYAIIALKDWEQIPLINNKIINYVSLNNKEKQIFKINLPITEQLTNYQVIAFSNPYRPDNFDSETYGTIRTVLIP